MANKMADATLIIGAGIAGIKAAIELAESGVKVYLCDRQPNIGGTLAQLDKWFPDNHCSMCKILPVIDRDRSSQYCIRRGLFHPNIEILPLTEVVTVAGGIGNFCVTVVTKPCCVNPELCISCGACERVCPVEVDSESGLRLEKHKAIYLPNAIAQPKAYIIDGDHCNDCTACVEACPTNAIDLALQDTTKQIEAGAIILATGFEQFDPVSASQYGYNRYPNVITSMELEHLLSNSGPSGGRLIRPSDGKVPSSIAFIQCVGCRDLKRNYCSSVCCMYAIKDAMIIREASPDADIRIFYMDLRVFGKGYHRYYDKARDELGIQFERCRVPAVRQDFQTNDLLVNVPDQSGSKTEQRFELVVLSVGQSSSKKFEEVSGTLGLETNTWDFCKTGSLSPVATNKEGIFVCGTASGPKDITDALIEAGAAAGQAAAVVSPARLLPAGPLQLGEDEGRVAIFICNCRNQITPVLNTGELLEFSKVLPSVVYAEEMDQLCRHDMWDHIQTRLMEGKANRVVLAACSAVSPDILAGAIPVELVNIREDLAWVHKENTETAMEKGKNLLAMALQKLKWLESPLSPQYQVVTPRALVIGGGIGGLVASLTIAGRGFEVELVEKSDKLGGNMNHVYSLLDGADTGEYLQNSIEKVTAHPRINVYMETVLVSIKGCAGSFTCEVQDKNSGSHEIEAGAIVVATGAEEARPDEYLYGQSRRILTQRELEERSATGDLELAGLKSLVMVQCVGSREKERPYCSRICCSQALKNALTLKHSNSEIEIVVFYRDLMSYGFQEEYYTTAREHGVLFIPYDIDAKPEIIIDGDKLSIKAVDPVMGGKILLHPDVLVLSPAIVPGGNPELARILCVDLTEDGFFQEEEAKFCPVDTTKKGIFVCGLAHSPRNITETIAQAQAAAQRASLLLTRDKLIPGRGIAHVSERRCSGCELCIPACPYNARIKDTARGVVVVQESLCQGCGACVTTCPNGASILNEFTDKQVFSMMDVLL